MEKYTGIYEFQVIAKVIDGKSVYMLDRKRRNIECVNGMTLNNIAEVLKEENKNGRFEFWIVEDVEENGEL